MGIVGAWAIQHIFELFSAIGIIGGLWFSAFSRRSEAKTRRIANLISITANHREVWKVFLNDKQHARVLDPLADVGKQPITEAERAFTVMLILHINSMYFASKDELVIQLEGWRRDIAEFLALPIPGEVWNKIKVLQNEDFVAFVDSCQNWK